MSDIARARRPIAPRARRRGGHHRPRAAAHLRVRRLGALSRAVLPSSCCPGPLSEIQATVRACIEPGCLMWLGAPAPGFQAVPCLVPTASSSSTAKMRSVLEADEPNHRVVARAGSDQSRAQPCRGALRLLLRAGPLESADLLHRRERGGELRRRPLPQVRLHHPSRDRAGGGRTRRRSRGARRRQGARRRRATTCSALSSAPKARSVSRPRSWSA